MIDFLKKKVNRSPVCEMVLKFLLYLFRYPGFLFSFLKFKRALDERRFYMRWGDRYPCLFDNTKTTAFDRHYIYHPAWASRIISKLSPKEHVDISSSLHFVTLISAFLPVRFYDYRPVSFNLSHLSSEFADLMALPFADNSIDSLSCMHVVEHIGLGRYGEPLDPNGDLKAMRELKRVLAKSGHLLFVVPIGRPRIEFNAHRIYSYDQVISAFQGLKLIEFSLIPDDSRDGQIVMSPSNELIAKQEYGCGCFLFFKE